MLCEVKQRKKRNGKWYYQMRALNFVRSLLWVWVVVGNNCSITVVSQFCCWRCGVSRWRFPHGCRCGLSVCSVCSALGPWLRPWDPSPRWALPLGPSALPASWLLASPTICTHTQMIQLLFRQQCAVASSSWPWRKMCHGLRRERKDK